MANNPATWAWRSRADRRKAERENLAKLGSAASAHVREGSPESLARARTLTNVTARAERAQAFKSELSRALREEMARAQAMPRSRTEPKDDGGGGGFWGGLKDVAGDVGGAAWDATKTVGKPALQVLDAGREYVGSPLFAIASGQTSAERKPVLDAQGRPTGEYYREKPGWGDMVSSLLDAAKDPVGAYQEGREAYGERMRNPEMNAFSRTFLDIGTDPLTWLGPGVVKGAATRALPSAVANSRGMRGAAALLEQPAAVGAGQVLGGATGAQIGESADLPAEVQMLLTLAGAIGGGVGGGMVGARGIARTIRDVDPALARLQGRAGKPAAIGAMIEETHPHLQSYVDALDQAGIEWEWDNATGTIRVTDPETAYAMADDVLAEYAVKSTNERGYWEGGGATHFGDAGREKQAGGASQAAKQADVSSSLHAQVDWAERVYEVLEEGGVDPARESLRVPWAEGEEFVGFEKVPEEIYREYRQAWRLKKTDANAENLGMAQADRWLATRVGPKWSKSATLREIYIEIDRAETFDTKLVTKGDYSGPRVPKSRVTAAFIDRLKQAAAALEAEHGILPRDGQHGIDAGAAAAGAGGVADGGLSAVEAAGGRGAAAARGPGARGPRPPIRFLGRRGQGRIATFEYDWGDARLGDVIETPYGRMEVTGEPTAGGVGLGAPGGEQLVGRFQNSNTHTGVAKSDTVLLRRRKRGPGTGRVAAVREDAGPMAGMRPEVDEDGVVARWVFKGGAIERGDDGTWFLDWEGRRYVGDSPEEVAAQVERGPEGLGDEMQDQMDMEDEMQRERPDADAYRDRLRERFLQSLEGEPDLEKLGPPEDEWDEFLDQVREDEAAVARGEQPAGDGLPEVRGEWEKVGQREESVDLEKAAGELFRLGINSADLPVNLPEIKPGLTRMDRWGNKLKELTGIGVPEDPLATPVMRARRQMQPVVDSQAARFGTLWDVRARQVFRRDADGRIVDLMGAPTIQDLAAKLPHFEGALTPEQMDFMASLRNEAEKYGDLIREAGITLEEYRPDVVEGGFYLPRGKAETEWLASLADKVPSGVEMGTGTKKGFEKGAVFGSMVEGIEAGFRYSEFGDALRAYARDAGRRALDQYASEYFKSLRYQTGQAIGMSYADRIDEGLRVQYQNRVKQLASLRRRLATAEKRAGVALAEADELDTALAAFLEPGLHLGDDLRGLSREVVAERRRINRLRTPERIVEVDRATNEVTELSEAFVAADRMERIVRAFEDQLPDSLDYANAVELAIGRTARRASELGQRGGRWATEARAIEAQLRKTQAEIERLQPEYRAAVNQARKSARDQHQIGFAPLSGRSFPIELANTANKWLQAERKPMGRHAGLTTTAEALNRLLRGVNATMDVSFMGIQGLLAGARDPKAYGTALGVAYRAMADPRSLGSYISEFDGVRLAKGRPTSRDWARFNLHIGGADTEFAIHAGDAKGLRAAGQRVAKAKGGKQLTAAARASNRMFGYFGDSMRLELADTMAEAALAAGKELTDDVMREIANAANHMTGWSPNAFGGSVGQLAMFAPRFFQAQLETVALAFGRGGIDNAEARKALLRLAAGATGLTVLANELSPDGMKPEQFLSPFRNPADPMSGWNPNFMRFRIDGNDYSLLGPWDSLLKAGAAGVYGAAGAGQALLTGDVGEARESLLSGPAYLARTKASPLLGVMWDLMSGETFMGEDAWAPDTMLKRFMPLSLQDLVGSGELFTPSGAVRQVVSMGGVKATPQSPSEQLDSLALARYGVPWRELQPVDRNKLKAEHPDVWQRAVERKDSNMQRVYQLQEETKQEQLRDDELLLSGQLSVAEWAAGTSNRRTELRGATEELTRDFDGAGGGNKVLQGYYAAIDAAEENGRVNWDQVDAYVAGLSEADRAVIERNAGASLTPVAKLKADLVRQYYSLPVYRGYDADEARAIDQLYAAVNAGARGNTKVAKMVALRRLVANGGVDEEVRSGVIRRIYGLLRETGERQKWRRKNPVGVAFLGDGPLTPEAAQAIRGMLASREAAA